MKPGPVYAAHLVEDGIAVDASPRPVKEAIFDVVMEQGWAESAMNASELAERWEERCISRLRVALGLHIDDGRPCTFEFNSSDQSFIQGACFVEPCDSLDLKQAKLRRSRWVEYTAALASVSAKEFEAVCRGVLGILGVSEPEITPYSVDEGIDFFGRVKMVDIAGYPAGFPRFTDKLAFWLVGQAKHYPVGQVTTPEIRELVGSVVLARSGEFSRRSSAYPNLAIRSCDPVFYLFFTTGLISSYGKRLLDASGVVGMDGPSLAAFLADSEVALVDGSFEAQELSRWIERQ